MVYLLGAGLSAAVGQIGITLAYSFAPAKIFLSLRIFNHFTAIFGFILFGETPDFYALIGYVIIIGASYYMFEKARRQTAITKQQSNTKE